MRIDPTARFAGVPLGRIREVLQRLQGHDWTMEDLRHLMGVDEGTFKRVAYKFRTDGLIELTHQWPNGTSVWHNSIRGGRLANASTTDKVPRALARGEHPYRKSR